MARYTESVCRLCRREGAKLFLKGSRCYSKKCSFERRPTPPGQHGVRRRKVGEYGLQLREKQKVRRTYGVLERQFRNYFVDAETPPGRDRREPPALARAAARQRRLPDGHRAPRAPRPATSSAHGHFAVNGRPTNISSYQLKPGDRIEVRESHRDPRAVQDRQGDAPLAPGAGVADDRPGQPVRVHRHAAIPRPDAARSQRAARGRVLLEVSRTHDRTREPADRACRGSRHVRQVRGGPAPGRLRRHPRQRPPARPPVVPRGGGRHEHPDP